MARAKAKEGIFLATAARITKTAAVGDTVPGGGVLSEFARHPLPALNDAGKVAFGASVAGARATEGIFLAADGSLKAIALSGADAPGVQNGTFVEFDAPVLNNRDEIAFVGTVRRGRETLQVLYLYSGGGCASSRRVAIQPRAVVAETALVFPRSTIKGSRLPAVLERAPYWAESWPAPATCAFWSGRQIGPGGAMLARFERAAIDDGDNVASSPISAKRSSEAVLIANARV